MLITINRFGIEFKIESSWLEQAGLAANSQRGGHIQLYQDNYPKSKLCNISDIYIPERSVPIFNKTQYRGDQITAQRRTVSILIGIAKNESLMPIQLLEYTGSQNYKYQLYDGWHRLHCAIALGHEQIPAQLEPFDENDRIIEGYVEIKLAN